MDADDLFVAIWGGGMFYLFGCVGFWAFYADDEDNPVRRARKTLAVPLWPILAPILIIAAAYRGITALIITAKPGLPADEDD